MKCINRTILVTLLALFLVFTEIPVLIFAESDSATEYEELVLHAQDEMNSVIPTEEVYSLRQALGLTMENARTLRLLAADADRLLYTGDLKEDGYLEFVSHETREVLMHRDFPGETIYAAELFGNGVILAHLPSHLVRQGANEHVSPKSKEALKLSFMNSDGQLTELWTSETFYPLSIFHMNRIGDRLIFAYDEGNAEEPGKHISRIGLISSDLSLSWLLNEQVSTAEPSLKLSAQPFTVGDNRAVILYKHGDESVLYEYDNRDGSLQETSLPQTYVTCAFPMKDGQILFSEVSPPPVEGYEYFLLSPDRKVHSIDLPEEWKLQQILPLGAEDNLWLFDYGRYQRPSFVGPKLEKFVSTETMQAYESADLSEMEGGKYYGHFSSFVKDGYVYLVVTERDASDIQVKKIGAEISSFEYTVGTSVEAPTKVPIGVHADAPTEDASDGAPVTQNRSTEEVQVWLNEQTTQSVQSTEPSQQNSNQELGSKVILNVPAQLQKEWYWCAPTTVSMMLAARGVEIDAADLASVMGTAEPFGTHNVNAISVLNTKLFGYDWPQDGQAGYRLETVTTADPMSDEATLFKQRFKQNIDDGYPMYLTFDIAHIYPGHNGEHNVPGIGYQMNENNTDIAYIYYLDPLPSVQDPVYGGLMKVTPAEFMNAMLTCVEPNYGW